MQKYILKELTPKYLHETVNVAENEQVTLFLLANQTADYDIEVRLIGKNARADILGIVIGVDMHVIKIRTLQKHLSPDTISDLHIKSVLSDQAFSDYAGSIRIEPGAQRSNAYQRNDNLMLSARAKAESSPGLEILANDVRCTHGATIGKIDPEQLFYLQSRGVSQKKAQELIIRGYLEILTERISDVAFKVKILKKINTYLNH